MPNLITEAVVVSRDAHAPHTDFNGRRRTRGIFGLAAWNNFLKKVHLPNGWRVYVTLEIVTSNGYL